MKTTSFFLAVCIVAAGAGLASCSSLGRKQAASEVARHFTQVMHYIALDGRGRIISGSKEGFIVRVDGFDGANLQFFEEKGYGYGQIRYIQGVAVDSKSRVYAVDQKNMKVIRIDDMTGKGYAEHVFADGELASLAYRGLCIDSQDRIYVTDEGRHRILRMDDMDGSNIVVYGEQGSGVGQFLAPYTLGVDSRDRIYIVDGGNSRIVRIDDMNGEGWVSFGSKGEGVGEFNEVYGVAFDAEDRIYISEGNQRLVRIDDMDGANWRSIRTSDIDPAKPIALAGIAIDAQQRLLFMDYWNGRICRIDSIEGDGFAHYDFGQ